MNSAQIIIAGAALADLVQKFAPLIDDARAIARAEDLPELEALIERLDLRRRENWRRAEEVIRPKDPEAGPS